MYINNIVAFGNTWEGSLERLEQVMVRLRGANLKLKAKKCFLFWHLVINEGIRP